MIRRLQIPAVVFLLSLPDFAGAQPFFATGADPKPAGMSWQPVENLSDDFEDGEIDYTKWHTDPLANGWTWIGRAPGLFLPENVSEADGKLKVTVSELPAPVVVGGNTYTYQGAIIRSWNTGGPGMYFEAKMKANATEMSSTFWLKPKPTCEKNLELDIQECVGLTSGLTENWARDWNQIYHSNAWHHSTNCVAQSTSRPRKMVPPTPNHERYYVYGCWWKSANEIQFFLDGAHVYTIIPSIGFDLPSYIVMAIETYDWNPVPAGGGRIASATLEERTTSYEWVRVWRLAEGVTIDAGDDQSLILPVSEATLAGTVSDPSAVASYAWTQVSGPNEAVLGGETTATLTASGLIAGSYVFRLTVTDSGGGGFSDQVTVHVAPNRVPSIRTSRMPYAEVGSGYDQAIEVDSGDAPFGWSIGGGSLPAGFSLTNGRVSGVAGAVGSSRFTVRVVDANGDGDEQELRLRVVDDLPGGTRTFAPIHDAYIEGTTPWNNSLIKIENGRRVGYLQFAVAGVSGDVESALLSMKVATDGGNGTIRFYEGSHSNWTESGLTDANKPAKGAQVGMVSGTFSVGGVHSADLAPLVRGNGTYSLVVEMDSGGNDVWFSSKEGSAPPQLVVTTRQSGESYDLWSGLHHGGGAAFDAAPASGGVPNGILYLYNADPGDGAEVSGMLPRVEGGGLAFTVPAEIPEDVSVWLEAGDSLSGDWPVRHARNADGTWPAPVLSSDNGDGTHSVTLPLDGGPRRFYRLVVGRN